MSRQFARTLAVVLVAGMVAIAVPGSVLGATETYSNSTDSEFEAGTLNGVSTTDDAVRAGLVDDFNDSDLVVENDYWSNWTSISNFQVVSELDGEAGALTSSGTTFEQSYISSTVNQTPDEVEFTVKINEKNSSSQSYQRVRIVDSDGDGLVIEFDHDSGLELVDGDNAFKQDIGSFNGNTRYDVRYDFDWSANSADIYINGAKTTTVDLTDYNLDPTLREFKLHNGGDDDASDIKLWIDNVQFHNQPENNEYIGDSHDIDDPSTAFTELSLTNSSATVTWQGYDGSSWTNVDTTTYTTSGNKTIDVSATDYTKYRVQVAYDTAGWSPDGELSSEGVVYDGTAPAVDNSSASPSGGSKLTDSDVTLSIDVTDTDFPTQQSDSVDVRFEVKKPGESSFTTHETKTIASNGTVTSDLFAGEGGDWDWRVVATDDYGDTTTSSTFTFTSPSTLYLYNETNPSELVTTNTPVQVTFFGDDQTITQTTTDGKVNLTSQNVTVPFVVQVEETDNYHSRTIYIRDIYSQQRVYLLNKNVSSVSSTFELNDPTGEFGPETVVSIKKPINVSGDTTYQTIVADRFGVEGVAATLEQGQRYRITVRSPDGDVQEIGPYRASTSEIVTIEPGAPSVQLSNRSTSWDTGATVNNQTLEVRYVDEENLTDQVTIHIHERGNESNQLAPNKTYQDPSDLSLAYALTANESEKEWVVNYEIDREGDTIEAFEYASRKENTTPSGLAPGWIQIFGVGAVILTAGLFSEADARLGAVATPAVAALLWYAGWLEGATSLAAITMGLFVGVLVYARGSARGY